jgi:hypothetical protein
VAASDKLSRKKKFQGKRVPRDHGGNGHRCYRLSLPKLPSSGLPGLYLYIEKIRQSWKNMFLHMRHLEKFDRWYSSERRPFNVNNWTASNIQALQNVKPFNHSSRSKLKPFNTWSHSKLEALQKSSLSKFEVLQYWKQFNFWSHSRLEAVRKAKPFNNWSPSIIEAVQKFKPSKKLSLSKFKAHQYLKLLKTEALHCLKTFL